MSETSVSAYSDPERRSSTPPQSPLAISGIANLHGQFSSTSHSPRASIIAEPNDHETNIPEFERKRTHVLVVEDK